ncbi:hypothetical protein [Aeromicrobium sp. UC242_57]|uniref:hypothetical protein n=1 Tax=Aeromicrobium sp. UC242_57 TaxID=3374624 RepID=UPI0037BF7C0F
MQGTSETLVAWMSSFSELSSPDDAVWFLGRGDFDARSGEGFAWNTFEMISAEAADTKQEAADVADFWSAHCPILLSVRGGYSYLAVRSDERSFTGKSLSSRRSRSLLRALRFCSTPLLEGQRTVKIPWGG